MRNLERSSSLYHGGSPQKTKKIFKQNPSIVVYFTYSLVRKMHSLIRGFFIQSCSTGAKNFTNYVFCHPQFSGVIQNIENHRAILTPVCLMLIIIKIINFIESKLKISKFCSYGTTIFNILDNTTELWMTKYIICEFFSSGGATLYKNLYDETVHTQ